MPATFALAPSGALSPVAGFQVSTEPSPLTCPNQPDFIQPFPSTYIQLVLRGVPSPQPFGLSGVFGVSPVQVTIRLSPSLAPEHSGSGSACRSVMNASQI